MTGEYTFAFGQPVRNLVQHDRSPKAVFVLGVYASAVHARWVGPDGRTKVAALAVASEPCIFWRGDGTGEVIAGIEVPAGVGKLVPAADNLNGPSRRSLDECFLTPMGITRKEAWLCDIVPHSCRNPKQDAAIQREYMPLMSRCGLPEVSLPPGPNPLCGDERRRQIVDELVESQATTMVLLGDEPIKWFLRFFDDRWRRLGDFGETPGDYGRKHKVGIAGREYDILPLVHPRQVSRLGAHSATWAELHKGWMRKGGSPCG